MKKAFMSISLLVISLSMLMAVLCGIGAVSYTHLTLPTKLEV
mgnify:CR=1 FL=1